MTPIRQRTIPTPPQFPEIVKLQSLLEPLKTKMREESAVIRDRLRNHVDEVPDYDHAVYVGARELAILDALRVLRNLPNKAQSSTELLNEFQRKIDLEVADARRLQTLQNEYEKRLGKGGAEGLALVQEILDTIHPRALALESAGSQHTPLELEIVPVKEQD